MKTDSLFQLVKSLTDAEQSAFFNDNEKAADALYMQLFHSIRHADVYNEKELKELLHINNSNFSVTKAYLTEAINKTLRNFHNGNDPEFHVPKEIHTIRVYLRKELHELAEKRMQQLKKYCLKYLLIEQMPELLSLEYHVAEILRKDTDIIEEERRLLSENLNDFFTLTQINHKLFNLYVKSGGMKEAELKQKLIPFEQQLSTFDIAKLKINPRVWDVYLGCGVWLSFMQKNMMQAFLYQKEKASLAFVNPYMRDFNARGLLAIANNVASLAFETGNFEEHSNALERMLHNHTEIKGYELFKTEHRIYHQLLQLQWQYDLPSHAPQLLASLENEFAENHTQFAVMRQLINRIVFAASYIKLGQPQKAQDHINEFLQHPAYKSNPSLYIHIRILQLISLIMLKEWNTVSKTAESLLKFVRKELPKNDPAVIFAKKLRSVNELNASKTFKSCLTELETCSAEAYTKFALHCFDIKEFLKRSL